MIVVAVDGSPPAYAARRGLDLRVVHVREPWAAEHAPGDHRTRTERLTHEAQDADALVLGNRGLGGFAGLLLGSVGLTLACHIPCPLVVGRAGGGSS